MTKKKNITDQEDTSQITTFFSSNDLNLAG